MQDLTVGGEGKQIMKFAIPMLLGNVFQQLYNIVDSIVVGQVLGKVALSAVGASFPVIFMVISLIIGIGSGSTVIVAQYFGAKDHEKVKVAADTLYIVFGVASVLVALFGFFLAEPIFRAMKTPEEIIPSAVTFLRILLVGSVFMFIYNGISSVLRGVGDSKTPLYFLIVSTLINIVLVIVFVKFLGWGIAGTAYGTVISQAIASFGLIIYLNRKHEVIKFSISTIRFDKEMLYRSIKIGLPSGIQQLFVALGMMALMVIVNRFGTDTVAAYSVAGRIDSFALLPAMNFSMALSAFVGQNIGANKIERVRKGLIFTMLFTSIISIVFSLTSVFLGQPLMHFFTHETAVVEIGRDYLLIVGSSYVLFSMMFTFGGVFRGAGDTLIPMFITLFSLWAIRVPLSYFLSLHWGYHGIWWGIPAAWAMGAVFSFFYYLKGNWKTKSIVSYSK